MVKIVYCSSKRPEQFWPPRLGYLHQPIISISGDLIPSSAVSSHTRDIPHTYTQLKILKKKENYLINFGTLIIEQSLFLITLCLVFVGLRIWNCKELRSHAAFRVLIFNMIFLLFFLLRHWDTLWDVCQHWAQGSKATECQSHSAAAPLFRTRCQ